MTVISRRVDLIVHLANEGRKVESFALFFRSAWAWRAIQLRNWISSSETLPLIRLLLV